MNPTSPRKIDAIIFDMDGVIIDSEGLWQQAEYEIFSSLGVKLSDDLCETTATMTTSAVTQFWFDRYPWNSKSLKEVEHTVIERVAQLIKKKGKAINGIQKFVTSVKNAGYKTGLATNSPSLLIPVVLEKLLLHRHFDAVSSAEHESEGKPDPAVYLSTAKKLGVNPKTCVAIEDSSSGLMAAKKAGMQTVAISAKNLKASHPQIVDHSISCYRDFDFSLFN